LSRFWKGYRIAGATVVLIGTIVVASATPAAACSCASEDARTRLAQSDAAIIGVVVGDVDGRFVVDLLEVAKGPFNAGDQIIVDPGDPSSSCWSGPGNDGILVGFLYEDRGSWNYSYCGRATAGELREAVSPLPEPTPGAARFLLAGQFGPGNNIMALARDGTIVGYGTGDVPIYDISVCPGGDLVLTSSGTGQHEVRNTEDLSVARETGLVFPGAALEGGLCLDAAASSFVSFSYNGTEREIFVTDGGVTSRLWSGDWYGLTAAPDRDYLYLSSGTGPITQLDLSDGTERELPSDNRPLLATAVSPDGRYLAGASALEPFGGQFDVVLVIDIERATIVARLEPPPERWEEGTSIHWFNDGRLGVRPPNSLLDVYDQSFNLIARAEHLPGNPAVNFDDSFVSFDELTMFETTFGMAGVRELTTLPSSSIFDVVALREPRFIEGPQPINPEAAIGRRVGAPPLTVVVTTPDAPRITTPGSPADDDAPSEQPETAQTAPTKSDLDSDRSSILLAALAGAAIASLLVATVIATVLRLGRRGITP